MTSPLDLDLLLGRSGPGQAEADGTQRPRFYRVPRAKLGMAILAAALSLPLLAGCGKNPVGTPDAVVVADSATANEPAPVLTNADRQLLNEVGADSTDGMAYVVNPNTGQPTALPLTPRRADGQVEYVQPRRDQLLDANVDHVQQALDHAAASGPFDLLTDIAAAVRVTSRPATLLVISSGLTTAGGFNLTDVGWGASPRLVAAQLEPRPAPGPDRLARPALRAGRYGRPPDRAALAAASHAGLLLGGDLPRRRRCLLHRRRDDPPGAALAQRYPGPCGSGAPGGFRPGPAWLDR